MKKLFSVIVTIMLFVITCVASEYDFESYIYPFGFRNFYSYDSSGKATSMSQFSFESQSYDNFIVEEVYIGMGVKSATNLYRYHIEDNAVVSDVQVRDNALTGATQYQDKIIIFAFPSEDKPYTWTETRQGEKVCCKSEYVYVGFRNNRTKAIKITENISYVSDKVKHQHQRVSYWIKNYGRVITYYKMDNGERFVSSKMSEDKYVNTFSEDPEELPREKIEPLSPRF